MNILKNTYEARDTDKFSKLNKLVIKFQLAEFFLVPLLVLILIVVVGPIVDNLVSKATYLTDTLKFSLPIWFGSIISFVFGLISVFLSIKGMKNTRGKKTVFIINLFLGLFGLLLLSGLTFFPQYYIIFDQL